MKIGKVTITKGPNIQWWIVTAILFAVDWRYGLGWLLIWLIIGGIVVVGGNLWTRKT